MLKFLSMIILVTVMLGSNKANAFVAASNLIGDKDTQVVYYPTGVHNIDRVHEDIKNFVSSMVFSRCEKESFKGVETLIVRGVDVQTESFAVENLSTFYRIGIEVKYKDKLQKADDVINLAIVQDDNFVLDYQDISLVSLGSTSGITCR
ncbi:MAG: hypothetical protein KC493_01030 [Bacteriovoracaceae bacterium]|nr:hypothetical protein [Bacteriovoracaceae bacterium]